MNTFMRPMFTSDWFDRHLFLGKLTCKLGFHRMNWVNSETNHVHCYCGEAVKNEGRIFVELEKMFQEAQMLDEWEIKKVK